MAIEAEFIKSIPYFSGLGLTELDSLKRFLFATKAERGEFISFESEPADAEAAGDGSDAAGGGGGGAGGAGV